MTVRRDGMTAMGWGMAVEGLGMAAVMDSGLRRNDGWGGMAVRRGGMTAMGLAVGLGNVGLGNSALGGM